MEDDDRISTGPKDHHWVTREVAAMMLTDLRTQQPELYGWYLSRTHTDANPAGPRAKRTQR